MYRYLKRGKMVRAGAEIFDKLEPEPHKNGPAPQHWFCVAHRSFDLQNFAINRHQSKLQG
jgi:hypothetical protein